MKKNRLRVLSLALLFILIVAFLFLRSVQFSNQRAENSPLRGEVIAVLDGDTVKVRMEGGEVKQ